MDVTVRAGRRSGSCSMRATHVRPARRHDLQCRLRILRHGRGDADPRSMQRMMDVNFMGTFYGARAALPLFRAQGHGHLIVISSIVGPARHRTDERLQRDEGGAGRVRRVAANRIQRHADRGQRRATRCRRRQSFARRWSATMATRSPASDRSSRWTMSRERWSRASSGRAPRSTRIVPSRALDDRQRDRARPSPIGSCASTAGVARGVTAPDGAATGGSGTPDDPGLETATAIARAIARRGRPRADRRRMGPRHAHGRLVEGPRPRGLRSAGRSPQDAAGAVRQRQHRRRELHRLQGRRHRRLAAAARVEDRTRPPRIRGRRRPGPAACRGGAAARLHHQRDRLGSAHRRVPRSVRRPRAISPRASCARSTPRTFGDDSLRVLRGAPVRGALRVPARRCTTRDLCRGIPLDDLPAERIWGEIEKLLLLRGAAVDRVRARRSTSASIDRLFPELQALVGCPQEPEWHPEGDVWVHTLMVIDQARTRIDDLDRARKIAVMLGAVCHDLGKPPTTAFIDGRIRSIDHEQAGRRAGHRRCSIA